MEENKLIEGCVHGESWAQKIMYESYAPAMMSVCQRYACNRETAQDLMHDGFVKMFSNIHQYSGTGSFNGWMRRIFVTTALEYLQKKDVLRYASDVREMEVQDEDINISLFEHLSTDDLLECIASLPERYRAVFNLHAIEGYSHAKIAGELGISETTSRSNYSRARQLLQKTVLNVFKSSKRG